MAGGARKRVGSHVERELLGFYEVKRCVVTGALTDIDWHHLNEDARDTVFANLVPVSRDTNRLLEHYRRAAEVVPPVLISAPLVSPPTLKLRAGSWFREGEPALAYGAARLALRMVIQYRPIFDSEWPPVRYAATCLSLARHANRPLLYLDVLRRDVPVFVRDLERSAVARASLLLELASAYEDIMETGRADAIYRHVRSQVQPLGGDPSDYVRMQRRRAISLILADHDRASAAAMLHEASDIALQHDSNLYVGVQNALVWFEISEGRRGDALDRIGEIDRLTLKSSGEPRGYVVAPWNALETTTTLQALLAADSRRPRRLQSAEERLRFQQAHGVTRKVLLRPLAQRMSSASLVAESDRGWRDQPLRGVLDKLVRKLTRM